MRSINGQDPWSTEDHLLAVIADRVGEMAWVTAQVNSKKRLTPPEPLPRPGRGRSNGHQPDHQAKRKHASIEDLKRFFGQPAGR